MSEADRVTNLNCKNCAAPLQLHGGHRVKTLTCGHCGTVMDVHDEFKVLDRYQNLQRPETPFQIGLVGTLKGVEFTVIGVVQYGYQDQWGTYTWVSSQLYSPTHGYAWITISDKGHVTFSRRVRELPSPVFPHSYVAKQSSISFRGTDFRFYEKFKTFVLFVEGELTWQARIHDAVDVAEFIAPPLAFEFETSSGELEYGLSEYIDPKVAEAAFGDIYLPKAEGIHPAQPYRAGGLISAFAHASYPFFVVAGVLLILVMLLGSGEKIASDSGVLSPGSNVTIPFTVTQPEQLLFLRVRTNVNNNWTYVDAEITDSEDRTVATVGREIGYYHGVSGGESWSEGSRKTDATLKVPAAGEYALSIDVDPQAPVRANAQVEIWQGYLPWRYLAGLTIIFLLGAVSLWVSRALFEKARWAEVIEDD